MHMEVKPGTSPATEVYITVSTRVIHNTATSDSVLAGTHQFMTSNNWVEITLTDTLQSLLSSPIDIHTSQLDVTLQSKLSCKEEGTESTIHFTDPMILLFTDIEIDFPTLKKLGFGGMVKRDTPRPSSQPSPPIRQEDNSNNILGSGESTIPTTECSGYKSTGQCSRQPLVVNFPDWGINSILQPPNVDIGYCNGNCNPASTAHSEFLRLLLNTQPNESAPDYEYKESCCVPSHYNSLTVLLRIDHFFVIEELSNVIIANCCCMP